MAAGWRIMRGGAARANGRGAELPVPSLQPPLQPTAVPLWRVLDAIAQGDVHPHYQPIVSLRTGDVVGLEALARWVVPGAGVVPATAFVPVLEHYRRVSELTACMLEQVGADIARWQAGGRLRPGVRVSVNVSATELVDGRLPAIVRAAVAAHGIEADHLCLELTETARIENFALAQRILSELAFDVGVRLAVDDYGTGFADGKYLTALPIDTVKIDQSFVAGMVHRPDHAAFVRATVGYAAHRELGVVAEGVEDPGQSRALLSVGCTIGQGFALGPPRPAEAMGERFGAAAHPAG